LHQAVNSARVGTLNDTRHLKFRHNQSFVIKKRSQ